MKILLYIFLLINSLFAYCPNGIYEIGDTISIDHQNQGFDLCDGDYPNDTLKLADFNGATNGGNYKIIIISMDATWCPPSYSYQSMFDGLASDYEDNPGVVFLNDLSDLGQPYSCEAWGNIGVPGIPLTVNTDTNDQDSEVCWMVGSGFYPSSAIIDHTLTLRLKESTASASTLINLIDELLEECGVLCNPPDVDEDGIDNNIDNCPEAYNPYQEDFDDDGIGDECDDCYNMLGDINDDGLLDIIDIVNLVNIVLTGGINSSEFSACAMLDANMDGNSIINILDVIQLINIVLGD